jgi:Domain of unknown function (DUF4369)
MKRESVPYLPIHTPAAILSLLILACSTPAFAQNTTIQGHLSGIADGKYLYLVSYPYDPKHITTDSAKVEHGAFAFHLTIPDGEGDLYFFSSVHLADYVEHTFPYFHQIQLLYLQKGRVAVNGDATQLDKAEWSGDSFIKDQNDYLTLLRNDPLWQKALKSMDYYREKGVPPGSHPLKESDTIGMAMLAGWAKRSELARTWVQKHPNSPYSTVLLFKDIKSFFDTDHAQQDSLLHQLSPEARNNRIGRFLLKWWDHK